MDTQATDLALLVLRVVLGIVMLAHGYNHIWGGGRIEGTARWFESLGMKPGKLHAWTASLAELGAGAMLVLGLATPLAAAGMIGVMVVAWVTNHRDKGFWVFNRPTEGYEYVMTLTFAAFALALLGGGGWSIDGVVGDPLTELAGWTGLWIALIAGFGGAAGLLVTFWRPPAKEEPTG